MGKTMEQLNYRIEWLEPGELKPYPNNAKWTVYMHVFPNGKRYIGITSQPPIHRWGHMGNGYKSQEMLMRAINRYGWNNIKHIIICIVNEKEEAERLEKHYISEYRCNDRRYGYNIENGGFCSSGYRLSAQTRLRMSESRRGEKNCNYGKRLSDEARRKMSEAHKGKKADRDAVKRGAAKRMGANAYNARRVNQLNEFGEIIARYDSLADAGRACGARTQDIYCCCVGRQKTVHGTRWEYAD